MLGLWTFILDHPRWEYLVSNCSMKTIDEWKLESIPNLPLAIFYITMGVVFEVKITDTNSCLMARDVQMFSDMS